SYPIESTRRAIMAASEVSPHDPGVLLAQAHLALLSGDFKLARDKLAACPAEDDFVTKPLARSVRDAHTSGSAPHPPIRAMRLSYALVADDVEMLRGLLAAGGQNWSFDDKNCVWAWLARKQGHLDAERTALENLLAERAPVDLISLERLAEIATLVGDHLRAQTLKDKKASFDQDVERYRDIVSFSADPIEHALELAELAEKLRMSQDAENWLVLGLQRDRVNHKLRKAYFRVRNEIKKDSDTCDQINPPPELVSLEQDMKELLTSTDRGGSFTHPRLVDDARLSGILCQYDPGRKRRRYLPETMGGGLALIDYDRDGWLDVFAVQGGNFPPGPNSKCADRMFRNKGDGTFEDATESAGF